MNMDKKTILAFLMIGMVLILINTPFYQKTFNPEGYEAKQQRLMKLKQQQLQTDTPDTQSAAAPTNGPVEEIIKITEPIQENINPIVSKVQQDIPEQTVNVETDFYRAQFSNKGAVLINFELLTFEGPDGTPVEMLPKGAESTLAVEFVTPVGDTLNTSNLNFSFKGQTEISVKTDKPKSIQFVLDMGNNQQLIKEFTFYDSTYHFDMNISMINMQNVITGKSYFISAHDGLSSTEKRINDDMQYARAGYAASGEVSKKFKPNGKKYKESATIDWIGVRTKYFTLAVIPQNSKGQTAIISGEEIPIPNDKLKSKWKKYSFSIEMPYRGNSNKDSYKVYMGPLDNDILKTYNVHLEKFMDFGMKIIQPFSIAILWSFKKLHTIIPNYGWVLIIFSVLIKIIVYPLTHKSYESMQRMQSMQPKLNELKEKYAKDPKKLNEATMKMYKEEKVNPLGGCLPMLLQMPLLWGLFIVFRTTIELRGEGFIGWITDLSSPDTIATLPFALPMYGDSINILPLFMGITMFMQQKLTVNKAADKNQKMMMYFMPIFLTLLFNQFPAGLNLYYALFNLLSIIQQKWLVPKQMAAASAGPVPKKKKM